MFLLKLDVLRYPESQSLTCLRLVCVSIYVNVCAITQINVQQKAKMEHSMHISHFDTTPDFLRRLNKWCCTETKKYSYALRPQYKSNFIFRYFHSIRLEKELTVLYSAPNREVCNRSIKFKLKYMTVKKNLTFYCLKFLNYYYLFLQYRQRWQQQNEHSLP